MRPPVYRRAAVAVAVALSAAACGGSPTSSAAPDTTNAVDTPASEALATYERINALSGQERKDALIACAEEEGELSLYTSGSDHDDIIAGFEDEYDITVSSYRGNGESVRQRILQEQDAGFYGNDVVETDAAEIDALQAEGFLAPYESELRDAIRDEGRAENWTANRFNTFVVGWNTDLVKPGEEPTSFEDLADPKWEGKLSMEVGDIDWFAAHVLHMVEEGKTEQEAVDLMKAIAANSSTTKGHTVQVELLAAGQDAVAVTAYSHTIDKAASKGAPVAWKPANGEPVQPLVVQPNGIAVMKTAANPCAGTLYIDWNLTAGQEVFAKAFRIGVSAEAAEAIAEMDVIAVPQEEMLQNREKWNELYAEVLQGS